MKIKPLNAHHRILIGLLALAFMLGVLNFAPVASAERICDGGCIYWNQHYGCLVYQVCCVEDNGSYECWQF